MNTILWALSSQCSFHCKYCYLDFPEDNNPINNRNTFNTSDLDLIEIRKFIDKSQDNRISRVFIAGAEPLSNFYSTIEIINLLKEKGLEVVLCTNGYLVEKYYKRIANSKIDAISISLDSYKKEYNDKYRQYPSKDGFEKVIKGIKLLKENSNIKVGIYMVLTRINLPDLENMYEFVAELKADYFVFQPIFLDKNSELYKTLTIRKEDVNDLKKMISKLHKKKFLTKLPNKEYIKMMIESIQCYNKTIKHCFAGDNLFFITPDGTIHGCPSSKIIPKEKQHININNSELRDIFIDKKLKVDDCKCFSEDCVNMWQLMSFDEILKGGKEDAQ